ncbi:MAG: stage II sporulation protein M [Candidatus Limivivens sp.]|nr:stage II sporulation protein M [Candidatus Limivivens sp.]
MNKADAGLKKGLTLTFLLGVILGIVTIHLCRIDALRHVSVFQDFLEKGKELVQEDRSEIFFRIFARRIQLFLLAALVGCAKPFLPLTAALSVITGWLGGIYFGGAMLQQGLTGFGMAAAAVVPQIFLYGGAVYLLLRNGWMREKGRILRREQFFAYLLAAFGLYFLGILTESCVNPGILRLFLKLF